MQEVKDHKYVEDKSYYVPKTDLYRNIHTEVQQLLRGATYNVSVARRSRNGKYSNEIQITTGKPQFAFVKPCLYVPSFGVNNRQNGTITH